MSTTIVELERYEMPVTHLQDISGLPLAPISAASSLSREPLDTANVQELPPVDVGRGAWSFCLAGFVLEALVWGFGFSYGIFQGKVESHMMICDLELIEKRTAYYMSHPPFDKVSHIAIAAVGPTALAIQYAEGLLLSFFYGRYPDYIKRSMWFGLALSVSCLLLSSLVNQAWLLIMLQGVGLGTAGGMLYWPVMYLLSDWFSRRRGLAGGIIYAGTGVGGFAFPLFVNDLLDNVGHRWTLRVIALLQVVIGGIAIWFIKARIPAPKFRRGQRRPQFIPPHMRFFKRSHFWTFTATNLLQAMSYFPVSLYISIFAESISSPLSATIVLSLFNSSGVVGQILIGYLSDRFPYPWIMLASTVGSALAAFLLWGFADTLARVFAFAIIFGGLSGGFSSVTFAAAVDSANPNPEQASTTVSAFYVFKGLAAVLGPILSGILLDAGQKVTYGPYGKFGFGSVELFVGTCAVASSVMSILVALTRPRIRVN
ncbi:MFS general substrate transporter [Panus rudis PR-1116 ss-1]|nr:MFS general substrate transporter [Panus rudis PR-1116 ss-1]